MSWKSTCLFLVLAGALVAFSIFFEHPSRQEQARLATRSVLPSFNPGAVTNVGLTLRGQRLIRAERSHPGARDWRLTEPLQYPADAHNIERLLDALAELQWQDRIDASELEHRPEATETYGLAQPQCTLEVASTNGSNRLDIGNISALGDQLFVKVVGRYDIYKVGIALTNDIPRSKDMWRDPALVNLEALQFQGIRARAGEKTFDLARDEATGLWQMTKPVQARADSPKIDKLLKGLNDLRAAAFINDDAPKALEQCGLQTPPQTPQLELSFWRETNEAFALQLGSNYYAHFPGCSFARRSAPSNIVLIPDAPLLPWETDSTNFLDRHMFSRPASNVDAIEVAGNDTFVVRRSAQGPWQVTAAGQTFAADDFFISDWMGGLTNVDLGIEKMVVADWAAYGLAKPELSYKLWQNQSGSNQLLAQIEFGSNAPGGVFERRLDEASVNIMPASEFGRMPRVSWQLRDRRLWSFIGSNVVSVTIHYLGGDRKYLRDPQGDWTLAPGYHGPPYPNWPQFEEGLYRLGQFRAIYWDAIGDDPDDRFGIRAADHRVTFEVRDGEKKENYEIAFGKRSPYRHPYAAVTKDGQRLIFEFPADLFDGFIVPEFTIPAALRQKQ